MTDEVILPEWTFGDRVRKARLTAGMTQAEFATAISVGEASLAQWETDRARPRDILVVAKRIEALTRIPAAWMLGVELVGAEGVVDAQSPFGLGTSDNSRIKKRNTRRPSSTSRPGKPNDDDAETATESTSSSGLSWIPQSLPLPRAYSKRQPFGLQLAIWKYPPRLRSLGRSYCSAGLGNR